MGGRRIKEVNAVNPLFSFQRLDEDRIIDQEVQARALQWQQQGIGDATDAELLASMECHDELATNRMWHRYRELRIQYEDTINGVFHSLP